MARPDSAFSMDLERSMSMQIRITTFEEHLLFSKDIDERRVKAFNLDKWNKDMQVSFDKKRKEAITNCDWEAMKALDDELRLWLLNYVVQCREKTKNRELK